jgi:hypothetical protein
MLTHLLAGQCKQSEKINYLSDRAEIYCDQYQWTGKQNAFRIFIIVHISILDALNDIAQI